MIGGEAADDVLSESNFMLYNVNVPTWKSGSPISRPPIVVWVMTMFATVKSLTAGACGKKMASKIPANGAAIMRPHCGDLRGFFLIGLSGTYCPQQDNVKSTSSG